MSPFLNCDQDCCAEVCDECLACILGLSDIEMKNFGRFLEEHKDAMRQSGLSIRTVDDIIEAATD
jgi:predicted transcriptional regulator